MKKVLVFLMLLLLAGIASAVVIQSTSAGGNWTAPGTWVGGVVPGTAHDVVINGLVYVNNHIVVNNLTIAETGSIMNGAGINWTLTVNHNFTNYGSCENNSTGIFVVYVGGNLAHYGVLVNNKIVMNGTGIVTLYQHADAGPIACPYFQSTSAAAEYQMLSDLRFENCQTDFYGHTIHMSQGSEDYDLSLSGGLLYRVVLDTDGFATLALSNNSYLYSLTADDIILQGSVKYYQDVFFQNLTIAPGCTVNTWNLGVAYNLYVYQTLTCYGTIQNLTGNVYLRLYGDLYNYGTMNSYYCYFMDTDFQYVYQSPAAQPFTCNTWGKPSTVTSGFVSMLSDLRFQNVTVDTNNRPLLMFDDTHNYGINVDGGKIYRTGLSTDGFSELTMSNDAYLYEVNCGDIITHGTVQTYGSVYFQNCVNIGVLRAWWSVQYVYVYNDLINWGTITNDTDSNTYFRVAGDLYNYGTISCYQMALNATGNQFCLIQGSISCPRFTILSMMGAASWYFNDFLQSAGADYKDVGPYTYGIWRVVAGMNERSVTLSSGATAPGVPQNLNIVTNAEGLQLNWDQVDGAVYYIVQAASAPEGPFNNLADYAYDFYLPDGVVRYRLDAGTSPLFFRVKAAN